MADLVMPSDMLLWMKGQDWNQHHWRWHFARWWDLFSPADQEVLRQSGVTRAERQEGAPGNGLDFLAMHRVMIQMLREQFPAHAGLLAGWTRPPTDPHDPENPLPGGNDEPFDQNMRHAVDRLHDQLGAFASEDGFGHFIQTSRKSQDPEAGVHGYLHNRWADRNSPVDLGAPEKNLGNRIFWRLHGWIDARWTAFRAAKGLPDDEPGYVAALQEARQGMTGHGGHHFGFAAAPTLPADLLEKGRALATGHTL